MQSICYFSDEKENYNGRNLFLYKSTVCYRTIGIDGSFICMKKNINRTCRNNIFILIENVRAFNYFHTKFPFQLIR